MKFSCVIPSLGRKELYSRCLPSISAQTIAFDQVIVVFDLSETKKKALTLPVNTLGISTGGGKGGPKARQIGYARAIGDYVFFLDDDDYVDARLLEETKTHIEVLSNRPDAIYTRVIKKWSPGGLPDRQTKPPLPRGRHSESLESALLKDWDGPYTSSGLFLKKETFSTYPVDPDIKGFNDVQVKQNLEKIQAKISYCEKAETYFIQDLENWRMTSDVENRVDNLRSAERRGLTFSDRQAANIVLSSICSSVRSRAHTRGLFSAIKDLIKGHKRMRTYGYRPNARKLIAKYGETVFIAIWLGVLRHYPRLKTGSKAKGENENK